MNLKNDIIFSTFFSRKGNEEFLIDFLEALLKRNKQNKNKRRSKFRKISKR